MRAWLALREGGVDFEERVVDIRKPQRFKNLASIGEFSPSAAVPVLVADDTVIFDSLAIMEYANDCCGGRLLPADRQTRARARAFLAWQHAGLSGLCARISFESAFYPEKRPLTKTEIAECDRLFNVWEKELAASGGPYLFESLSLADLALVPTIIRLTAHKPDMSLQPRVKSWCDRLCSRASVREWMEDAKKSPPVWLDDYQPLKEQRSRLPSGAPRGRA